MKAVRSLFTYRWYLFALIVFAGSLYYFNIRTPDETTAAPSFYVINAVDRGEVSSGIQTTGDIVAAQKLDIDVYKQLSRIDVVNVQNGSHVQAGEVLLSFDKNDAYVDTESARVAVAEAALALETEQTNATDPNTEIRTLENQILGYQKTIDDAEQSIKDAYRDFLNESLEVVPHSSQEKALADVTEPTLSGRYVNDEEGTYTIEIYNSGAESGFSYRVSGLESSTQSLLSDKTNDLGSRGLKISFPDSIRSGDKWIVEIPNTSIATYTETKQNYEETIAGLEKTIRDATVSLTNTKQELSDLKLTDTSNYRDLNVEKAETALAEARQRLSQNYDVVQERDIVAPFSGTVEGMENVVVGATPTGGSEDTIHLGTLISDEFLTTFTLSATDVSKIEVGQKVKVTVTSFAEQPTFTAIITQISSLPDSTGVAQYEVQALLDYDRTAATVVLREGMLADIEVVEKENSNTLRVPTSAITYEQGVPKVTVVDQLTEQQKQQVDRLGIVRTEGATLSTYQVTVELGIIGKYYAEVISGIEEGTMLVSSSLNESSESVVSETRMGPGSGEGQRPPEE
ncbi:MAG: efflux RND transporter periplasmic adaptor subunit [Candidatus Pacebacteria bacterium]|nr:efflux RND transporter periplasmic adaptor subunit [Candidatus Paceibacterota bacterium]